MKSLMKSSFLVYRCITVSLKDIQCFEKAVTDQERSRLPMGNDSPCLPCSSHGPVRDCPSSMVAGDR
jgi:hypothetical protein